MQKNSGNFSMNDVANMANSPAGRKLLELLKSSDPHALEKAMQEASAGNFEGVKETLSSFMKNKEAQRLLNNMGGVSDE